MQLCSPWERIQEHHNSSAPQCHTFPSGLYAKLMPLQTRQYSNSYVEKKKVKQ